MKKKFSLLFLYFILNYSEFYFCNAVFTTYNGPIAGGKTISDCVNGTRKSYTVLDETTSEKIRREGYAAEEHLVLTEDGYLLTVHRIPGPKNAPIAYLLHGIISSSFDYVVNGKDNALAFLLADQGYDVWMGNQRGSDYSRCHTTFKSNDRKFWDFSFHEMGTYDLPAQIDYIQKITGKKELTYVGHSMGATAFFVLATQKPEVAANIKAMFALAPAVFNYHLRGIGMFLSPTGSINTALSQYLVHGEVLNWKILLFFGCTNPLQFEICLASLFSFTGFDHEQINPEVVKLAFHHIPAGASWKSFNHLAQSALRNTFKLYDYGLIGNLRRYKINPPDYDLTKVQVPVGVFYGVNDYDSNPEDIEKLWSFLPNKIIKYEVPYKKFNHFDFVWAKDARELLFNKLLTEMEKYR